jgi:magnesium transporter
MITMYYSRARERALQVIREPRAGMWVVGMAPGMRELDRLAHDFDLDRDNLDDAVDVYEAPRVEVKDGAVYMYTRYCHPEGKEIATEPLLIIYTDKYIFTILRLESTILSRLTNDELEYVTTQKTKLVLQILSELNHSYEGQLNKVAKQILRIRGQMRQSRLSTREFLNIIELEEDLNEFLSALQPQALLFRSLLSGKYLRLYEEDREIIEDIERSTSELIEQLRGRLRTLGNMREAYDAIATNNLNTVFKRLTSISIFLTVPTVVAGMWGINDGVPFQHSRFGFIYVLCIIIFLTSMLAVYFHHKDWL